MSLKTENEITVRVTCSGGQLSEDLLKKGFNQDRTFSMDDYYLVPSNLDINNLSTREIISKAIIIRRFTEGNGKDFSKITFKKKDINDAGEILSQTAFNCSIESVSEAINLFKALGYMEIMNIKEDDVVFVKGDAELAVKFVEGSDILIEFETCDAYETIDDLKTAINSFNIQIDSSDYFVKKAEVVLNKTLGR